MRRLSDLVIALIAGGSALISVAILLGLVFVVAHRGAPAQTSRQCFCPATPFAQTHWSAAGIAWHSRGRCSATCIARRSGASGRHAESR